MKSTSLGDDLIDYSVVIRGVKCKGYPCVGLLSAGPVVAHVNLQAVVVNVARRVAAPVFPAFADSNQASCRVSWRLNWVLYIYYAYKAKAQKLEGQCQE